MTTSPIFRIKICGIRFNDDVTAAEESTADAVGLNFFPPSVRFIDPMAKETAALAETARLAGLVVVGVFVDQPLDRIAAVAEALSLGAIQLHGNESLGLAESLAGRGHRVVRAIKLPTRGLNATEIRERTVGWSEAGTQLLLDADAGAAHGGSGKTLDWEVIREWAEANPSIPWTLAGGLNESNVETAIRRSTAVSVDVASGVESTRGLKSRERILAFAAAARRGWDRGPAASEPPPGASDGMTPPE